MTWEYDICMGVWCRTPSMTQSVPRSAPRNDVEFKTSMHDLPHKAGRVKPGCYCRVRVIGRELKSPTLACSDSLCRVCALEPYHQKISVHDLAMCPVPPSVVAAARRHLLEHLPLLKWISMTSHREHRLFFTHATGVKQFVMGDR